MTSLATGSAGVQGNLWGTSPRDWAEVEEGRTRALAIDVIGALGIGAGTRVLDAGCGAGMAAVEAAERGAVVTGLDASAAMIAYAKERLPRARFEQGDLETLPFDANAFDVTMAINSVFYCQDVARAMHELARVTRTKVAVTAWGSAAQCELAPLFAALMGTLPARPAGPGPFALAEPGALERLLEGAGLRATMRGESRCDFTVSTWERFWRGVTAAGPVQGAIRAAGEAKVKEAVYASTRPFSDASGAITMSNTFVWAIGEKT